MMPAPTAMIATSQPAVPAAPSVEDQRLTSRHAEADRHERQQLAEVAPGGGSSVRRRSGSTAQKAA